MNELLEEISPIIATIIFVKIWENYVGVITSIPDYFWCFVLFIVTNIIHSYILEYLEE